ncbi:hypothetical protein ACA910_014217 [Epithemia clementina (nom. ined.)]
MDSAAKTTPASSGVGELQELDECFSMLTLTSSPLKVGQRKQSSFSAAEVWSECRPISLNRKATRSLADEETESSQSCCQELDDEENSIMDVDKKQERSIVHMDGGTSAEDIVSQIWSDPKTLAFIRSSKKNIKHSKKTSSTPGNTANCFDGAPNCEHTVALTTATESSTAENEPSILSLASMSFLACSNFDPVGKRSSPPPLSKESGCRKDVHTKPRGRSKTRRGTRRKESSYHKKKDRPDENIERGGEVNQESLPQGKSCESSKSSSSSSKSPIVTNSSLFNELAQHSLLLPLAAALTGTWMTPIDGDFSEITQDVETFSCQDENQRMLPKYIHVPGSINEEGPADGLNHSGSYSGSIRSFKQADPSLSKNFLTEEHSTVSSRLSSEPGRRRTCRQPNRTRRWHPVVVDNLSTARDEFSKF